MVHHWFRSHLAAILVAWPILARATNSWAQTESADPATRPRSGSSSTAKASRVTITPKIDGLLNDPAWQTAEPIGGFVQRDPDEGRAATEATEVRVLYSDDALWIAVRATDSKAAGIVAILSRRDESSPSDEVTVMIDSYHDRRTGFAFTVNAAGVKRDAHIYRRPSPGHPQPGSRGFNLYHLRRGHPERQTKRHALGPARDRRAPV